MIQIRKNINEIIKIILLVLTLCIMLSGYSLSKDFSKTKIGLVHSSLTKQLLHSEDDNFYPTRDLEIFFLNKKISYEVFDDDGLDDFDFDEMDILILPSVEIISDDGLENLREFLKAGKGLFILGNAGTVDNDGKNRQMDALRSLAGLEVKNFLRENTIAKKHMLYNNNFLTHNLQLNSSLIVMQNYPISYAENYLNNVEELGEYFLDDNKISGKPGIVKMEVEYGRIIWFGFQLSQISSDEEDVMGKLLLNSVEWLSGNPIAWMNQWYLDLKFAAAITSMVENPVEFNIDALSQFALSSQVIANNLFITPQAVISFPEEVERLAHYGDINVLFDELKHFDFSREEKIKLIEDALKILRNRAKQSLFGIKYINSTSKQISDKTGCMLFDFIMNEDNSIYIINKKSMLPFTHFSMLLPAFNYEKLQNDINNEDDIINQKNLYSFISRAGGFLPVSYLNQFSSYRNNIDSEHIRKILSNLRSNNCWIASYSSLIQWLINKENILVKIKEIGEKRGLNLVIENRNKAKVGNLGVILNLPKSYRNLSIPGNSFILRYDARTGNYILIVPYLMANQSTTIEVYYDN